MDLQLLQHTAETSKLSFTEEEYGQLLGEINPLIDSLSGIFEVDVEGVPATYRGNNLMNVVRQDEPMQKTSREDLLKNTKAQKNHMIQVPTIMNDESEA